MKAALAKRPDGLAQVEQLRQLITECTRVDEAQDIRDKASAIASYLRQQKASLDAQNSAAEIKLRAERRLGELLEPEREKRGGANGQRVSLPDGITHKQSSRWQDVARVPAENFERFIEETRASGGEITTAGLRREHAKVGRTDKTAHVTAPAKKWDDPDWLFAAVSRAIRPVEELFADWPKTLSLDPLIVKLRQKQEAYQRIEEKRHGKKTVHS